MSSSTGSTPNAPGAWETGREAQWRVVMTTAVARPATNINAGGGWERTCSWVVQSNGAGRCWLGPGIGLTPKACRHRRPVPWLAWLSSPCLGARLGSLNRLLQAPIQAWRAHGWEQLKGPGRLPRGELAQGVGTWTEMGGGGGCC